RSDDSSTLFAQSRWWRGHFMDRRPSDQWYHPHLINHRHYSKDIPGRRHPDCRRRDGELPAITEE
ncbi:hypothetical protein J6590_107570, partial [Homalodisca vitripennis]